MFKKKSNSTQPDQPRPKRRKRWPWVIGALILIVVIVLSLPQVMQSGNKAPVVEGVKVEKGPIAYKISTRGDVLSKFQYDVVPRVSGRVSQVHVKEGELVKKDQVLVTLEASDIQEQLADLELEMKMAKATLAQIEVPSNEGKQATKDALEAQLAIAENEFANAQVLFEEGSYTKAQVAQADLALKNAKQNLANHNTTNAAKKAQQERELQMLRINSLQVKIDRLNVRIEQAVIKAPAAGTVSKIMVKVFDVATGQMPVVTIVDVNALQISTNINQYDIHKIAVGLAVNVTADGLKDQVFNGKISSIAAVAQKTITGQSQETVVPVLIDLDNTSGAFKPNFTARVEIVIAQKEEATLIPYEATRIDKTRGRLAYVIQDGKLIEKVVKSGIEGELFIEMADDAIKVGDYLLLNPDETHTNGMAVTFTPASEEVKP